MEARKGWPDGGVLESVVGLERGLLFCIGFSMGLVLNGLSINY
jgi:hypothetical protein